MPQDVQDLIQTLVQSSLTQETYKRGEPPPRPVVALSRDHGAGGMAIAQRLAQELGVAVYDHQLIDAIAAEAKVNRELMERLDEKPQVIKDSWLYTLLSGRNASIITYRHHLVNAALYLALQGGVFVGRGIHYILADRGAFRVRIVGSEYRCADRLMAGENLSREEALKRLREVNGQREAFLQEMFKRSVNRASDFDLIVNTDRIKALEEGSVGLIMAGMQAHGLPTKSTQ